MPQGVASHFLDILAADQRSARSRMVSSATLGAALFAPALLLAGYVGIGVHAASLFVGVVMGVLWARSRVRRFEGSIRTTWTQWMRYAVAAETISEIHRKVRGRSGRNLPFLYAAILFLVWGFEVALLVLAFTADAPAELAAPAIALNGLLAGALAGHFAKMRAWYGTFRQSVSELVNSGEIGMWGVM